MKNKKGFTLIELLAVIVILAVVMLIAATAVIPLMTKSRKNALLDEGYALEKAAKLAYQDPIANINGKTVCITLEYLNKNGFYEKGSADKYTGSVYIVPVAGSSTFTTKFWISNGTYAFNKDASEGANNNGATSSGDNKTTYENAVDAGNATYNTCGGNSSTSGVEYKKDSSE